MGMAGAQGRGELGLPLQSAGDERVPPARPGPGHAALREGPSQPLSLPQEVALANHREGAEFITLTNRGSDP